MGEIAEAMIAGKMCCECGCCLEIDAPGIPVMCHDCHSQYQKSCKRPSEGKDGGIMCENFYS